MTCINVLFSVLIALMAAVAAGNGLYQPGFYSNNETIFLRLVANQDFVILTIFIPLLLTSTWLAAQNHFRGTLAWLGAVGYLSYVYSGYAFGGISAKLFLLHIAIAALSFFLLYAKLTTIDPEEIRLRFTPVTSFGFTAFFLIAIALLMETLWLQEIIPSLPKLIIRLPFLDLKNVLAIQVLDLAFLGPLSLLTGFWLYFHKAVGYVFTAMLLVIIPVKFGTMIFDFNLILNERQTKTNLVFTILTLVAVILLICFLKKLKEEKLTSYYDRISNSF